MNLIIHQNQTLVENSCYTNMVVCSLLISYATSEEKKQEYKREFNHYKYYDI